MKYLLFLIFITSLNAQPLLLLDDGITTYYCAVAGVDGDFSDSGDFTVIDASWSIAGGVASYDATTNAHDMRQGAGASYGGDLHRITFTISNAATGARLGISNGTELSLNLSTTTVGNGTHVYEVTIDGGDDELRIYGYNTGGAGAFDLDNVIIEKIQTTACE